MSWPRVPSAEHAELPGQRLTQLALRRPWPPPGIRLRAGKPKKCAQECKKSCPVVRMGTRSAIEPARAATPVRAHNAPPDARPAPQQCTRRRANRALRPARRAGKLCIEVSKTSKVVFLSEELCIGCGICVKKCPFGAISIINLPKSLESQTTHRYGPNSFKLHRLPLPRPGQVLGLVGSNGTGKSTALKILAGKQKPNLGNFDAPPDWEEILKYFRGSELQNYFTRVLEDDLKAIIKPQYVDHIPRAVKGQVGEILRKKDERNVYDARDGIKSILEVLDLVDVQVRPETASAPSVGRALRRAG
jgi:translation initiation factor RLI1